jgi:hypothetical protein
MAGKQVLVDPGGGRRRWAARVAADGALALVAGLIVVSLLAIPAVRRIASAGMDTAHPPRGVPAASPTEARAARRREHMARLPRWREIRREAREGGTPPRPVPAGAPPQAHPDSTPCASACAPAPGS